MTVLSEAQAKEALVVLEQKAQHVLDKEDKNHLNRHLANVVIEGCVELIKKNLTTRELRVHLLNVDAEIHEVGKGESSYAISQAMMSMVMEYRDFLKSIDIAPRQNGKK